jgi:hypothetical protein
MARFRPDRYDPRVDSSPNTEAWRPGHKRNPDGLEGVILDWRPLPSPHEHMTPCPCGCRKPVTGARSRAKFVVGHDARLKGILSRAHVTATPVYILTAPMPNGKGLAGLATVTPYQAVEVAAEMSSKSYDWVTAVSDAADRLGGDLVAKQYAADRRVLAAALNPKGGRSLLHVGKWEQTGHLLAVYIGPDLNRYYEWTSDSGTVRTANGHAPDEDATEQEGAE